MGSNVSFEREKDAADLSPKSRYARIRLFNGTFNDSAGSQPLWRPKVLPKEAVSWD